MPFGKNNYQLIVFGVGVILLGFILMSLDQEEFGFGFLGLTLGPIILFLGFMIEFYAILRSPKKSDDNT